MSFIKYKVYVVILLGAILSMGSCTGADEYLKFTEGGAISYVGKIESLKVFSGRNRVKVEGLIISDPKVTQMRVYWNNKKDSVVVPIDRTSGVDAVSTIIENLPENIYNFEVKTFDAKGNSSVSQSVNAQVYGERYQASLVNRLILSHVSTRREMTINFSATDLGIGVYGTEVTYTDNTNAVKTVFVPVADKKGILQDFKFFTSYTYRTSFKPDPSCIDMFYLDPVTVTPACQYLINNLNPYTRLAYDGARWGTPTDWIVNDAAKSHTVNGVIYGGLDGLIFNLESGFGQPNITNGKVYQTLTLPAGTFTYIVNVNDTNYDLTASDKGYYVIAKGNTLPDVAAVETSTSTLKWERGNKANKGSRTLVFTLAEPTEVSVGVATTTIGNKFLKINYFTLTKN